MEKPPRYVVERESAKVCKLNQDIYGFKQSPQALCEKFTRIVTSLGFKYSKLDTYIIINPAN